jgi:hypothetical protein
MEKMEDGGSQIAICIAMRDRATLLNVFPDRVMMAR